MNAARTPARWATPPDGPSTSPSATAGGVLEAAGAAEAVEAIALPVKARCMHDRQGVLTYQPYGLPGQGRHGHDQCIYSVARGPLNRILLEQAEATGRVTVHFEHRLSDFSVDAQGATLHFEGRAPR